MLMAPAPGAALVGPGPAEVRRLVSWDDPDMTSLLAGDPPPARLAETVGACDLAIAYTRSAETIAGLRRLVPRVVAWNPQPPPGSGHASRWLAEAVAGVALGVPDPVPSLVFSAAEQADAQRQTATLPAGFVAVHPGSGSPAKNWPRDRFVEVARRRAGGRPWLLALGPAEGAFAAPPDAVVAREWPVRVLGAALAGAGLFVGNDSGASHLAAATGAPTVALFGPTDPDVWAPVGNRVTIIRAPGGDLMALDVETVLARISGSRSPS